MFAIGGILQAERDFLSEAAASIERPVLLMNQSDDELFSREAAFRLYDTVRGPKRIIFHPGLHAAVPREAMELVRDFLRLQLAPVASDAPRGAH